MSTSEPGAAFQGAIRRLRRAAQDLGQQAQQPYKPILTTLLQALTSLVPRLAVQQRRCPEAYVEDWQHFLRRRQQPLPIRTIRFLCWEPTVATDERFHAYLENEVKDLSARSLRGLVWSCHSRWSQEFATSAVVQRVYQRLETYQGSHWLLVQWRKQAAVLLTPPGPNRLAASMVAKRTSIAMLCNIWALDEHSPYVLTMLHQAVVYCLQWMENELALCVYLITELLSWSGWSARHFRATVAATVQHPVTNTIDEMPEQLTALILSDSRLGDPRLPQQEPYWQEIPDKARQRVLQWASRADLKFFFDHVLPESKDREDRQAFWVPYVLAIQRSRPLLCASDALRLQTMLYRLSGHTTHFGAIAGDKSAFLIDLGAIIVVQFSDLDEGCYLYDKRNFARLVPDFWRSQVFNVEELTVSARGATIYYHQAWEKDVAEILTPYDIRPTYKHTS